MTAKENTKCGHWKAILLPHIRLKIGISNGTLTEILSGITENMPVVTEAVVNSNTPQMEGVGENGERSPFMPGSGKQEKKQ